MNRRLLRKWLIIGTLVATGLLIVASGFNTTGAIAARSYNVCGNTGTIELLGGRGNTGTEFVASWDETGESEAVGLRASVAKTSQPCIPDAARYAVFVGTKMVWSKVVWTNSGTQSGSGLPGTLPGESYKHFGPVAKDENLWAELQFEFKKPIGRLAAGWHTAAIDGATLLNGAGTIELDGDTSRFAEGETATFRVKTGNGGPWLVQAFTGTGEQACGGLSLQLRTASWFDGGGWSGVDPGAFARCNEIKFDNKFDGKIQMTIPKGAFRSDGRNEWKLVLMNAVTAHSEARAFVIDNSKLAPEVPKVSASPNEFTEGDSISLEFEARPNGVSQSPITKFTVTVWYGAKNSIPGRGEDLVFDSKEVVATKNGDKYVGELKFAATKSAKLWWRANSVDSAGRPSGTVINGRQVDELEKGGMADPNPNGEGHLEPDDGVTEDPAGNSSPPESNDMSKYLVYAIAGLTGALGFATIRAKPLVRGGLGIGIAGAVFWGLGRLFG